MCKFFTDSVEEKHDATQFAFTGHDTCEKLKIIDQVLDDLMKNPNEIPSPEWHRDVLSARAQRFENGEAKFEDFKESEAILLNEFK